MRRHYNCWLCFANDLLKVRNERIPIISRIFTQSGTTIQFPQRCAVDNFLAVNLARSVHVKIPKLPVGEAKIDNALSRQTTKLRNRQAIPYAHSRNKIA